MILSGISTASTTPPRYSVHGIILSTKRDSWSSPGIVMKTEAGSTTSIPMTTRGIFFPKKEYTAVSWEPDVLLSTDTYTYSSSVWGDLLTSYNNQPITYDANGNPLSYLGMTLTWAKGRRLATLTKNSATTTYAYDRDGLRVQKTVGGVTHTYTYLGDRLVCEEWGNCYLYFIYDETDRPYGLIYCDGTNTDYYYFLRNLQGDVIELLAMNGETIAYYEYDAWGKLLSVKDASGNAITSATHIANINPIRYRGYYYDTESGFYYLRSRYYDPEICRFINSDDSNYLKADGEVLSYNLFTYCLNDPINRTDNEGNFSLPNWAKVTIGAVAIVGLAIATVCTGGAAGVICGAALTGAITGGASGAVMGAIGGGISGGLKGAIDGACSGFMTGTLIGGASGAATAGISMASGAVEVVGSAQKTGTLLHRAASNIEAGKMAMNPIGFSKITLNRSLNTAGLYGRRIPDVIGIARDGSSILVEVVSKSQTVGQMASKCLSMCASNPGSTWKVVGWAASFSQLFR